MKQDVFSSLRLVGVSLLVCSVGYPLALWVLGQAAAPRAAEGSLIRAADGRVVGSALIAQKFTSERYFWPRPSAVDWNAAAAGGSNLSPAGALLAERVVSELERPGLRGEGPVPAELVLASGSGLDPHLSASAARYQVARVAAARGLDPTVLETLIASQAETPFLVGEPLVNVLELNLALDKLEAHPR